MRCVIRGRTVHRESSWHRSTRAGAHPTGDRESIALVSVELLDRVEVDTDALELVIKERPVDAWPVVRGLQILVREGKQFRNTPVRRAQLPAVVAVEYAHRGLVV